jgi:hypothetical protein
VITHHRHDRLAARPALVTMGARVSRVRGHETLLDREHEVVRGVQSCRWQRRVAPPKPELERMDRLTQARWSVGFVFQAQCLDVVEQDIGFGEQGLAPGLGSVL